MDGLKNIVNKIYEPIKEMLKKFPLTLAVIVFATIFLVTAELGYLKEINMTFVEVCWYCLILASEFFFIENVFVDNKKYRIIGYILFGIIAFIFDLFIYKFDYKYAITTTRIFIGYILILFQLSTYVIIKQHKIRFEKYILNVCNNLFRSTIIYSILVFGLTLLILIFAELLLDSKYAEILVVVQTLLFELFFIPQVINSVCNVENKNTNSFIQKLLIYILLPLIQGAMAIIYVYIAKILISRELPSNEIFRILAGIFAIAFPIWNMVENFKDKNKYIEKSVKFMPYFYIPFILLESYVLYIRVAEVGLTPTRYFGIMFIIAQTIAIILTIEKGGEKLPKIFIYLAGLILIAFISPLNYGRASALSQKNILIKAFPQNANYEELSEEDQQKAKSAYRFLIRKNEDYIPEYISEQYEVFYRK